MYCSECGKPARGKFCSHCGTRLDTPDTVPVPFDWEREHRYESLLTVPHVRGLIDRHAALAPKRLSGEKFLELCEKVVPLGLPAEAFSGVVLPFAARLGIGTGKTRAATVPAPVGVVLCRILCSLARHGQEVRNVRQGDATCEIEAALPSDIWSFEGDLFVTVRKAGASTEVEAATKIAGQMFDWGKSRRCLDALFADVRDEPAELSA